MRPSWKRWPNTWRRTSDPPIRRPALRRAPVPKSVVLQYMATVFVGVLIYVSDSEERWTRFKQPISAVLVERRLRVLRTALLGVVTLVVGWITFGQARTTVAAPPDLRSIHPAPPSEIT